MSVYGPKGEPIVRTCDYVIASRSSQGKIKKMEVVEDFKATQGGDFSGGESQRRFRKYVS